LVYISNHDLGYSECENVIHMITFSYSLVSQIIYTVLVETLNPAQSINQWSAWRCTGKAI